MSAGAAAAAAIAQAIKAMGVIVSVEPDEFERILARQESPLAVTAQGGIFSTTYQYLTSYKGLAFYAQSTTPLSLSSSTEVIVANKIWIPG